MEQFFKDNVFIGTERTVQQSLETIRLHKDWLERDVDGVRNYLRSGVPV